MSEEPTLSPTPPEQKLAQIVDAQEKFAQIRTTGGKELYQEELAAAKNEGPGNFLQTLASVAGKRERALNRINGEAGEALERSRKRVEAEIEIAKIRQAAEGGIVAPDELTLAEENYIMLMEELTGKKTERPSSTTPGQETPRPPSIETPLPPSRMAALSLIATKGEEVSFDEVQQAMGKTVKNVPFSYSQVRYSLPRNANRLLQRVIRKKASGEELKLWDKVKESVAEKSGETNLSDVRVMRKFMPELISWLNNHNPKRKESQPQTLEFSLTPRGEELVAAALRSRNGVVILNNSHEHSFNLSVGSILAIDRILTKPSQEEDETQNLDDSTRGAIIEAQRVLAFEKIKRLVGAENYQDVLVDLDPDTRILIEEIMSQQNNLPDVDIFNFLTSAHPETKVKRDKQLMVTGMARVWYAPEFPRAA